MSEGYLAARYSRREELCEYRGQLAERGHRVRARWLDGGHQVEGLTAENADTFVVPTEDAERFAIDDVEDIAASSFLVAFTEQPRTGPTRGGRHWELGFASGLRYERWPFSHTPRIYIVGPLEHVFTTLPIRGWKTSDEMALIDGRYETFAAFLSACDARRIRP